LKPLPPSAFHESFEPLTHTDQDDAMRRLASFAAPALALAFVVAPAAVDAQPRIMAGAGISTPFGDLADGAGVGWHAGAGLQLGFPTLPVAIRADGAYHSFGEESPAAKTSMLGGALSLVINLPGVGLVPYFLGGVGMYRRSVDGFDPVSDPGFHGAFGVNIGALGFGGFGEVRLVNVNGDGGDARFVTATVGFRL
jgi:hypothetical protein